MKVFKVVLLSVFVAVQKSYYLYTAEYKSTDYSC